MLNFKEGHSAYAVVLATLAFLLFFSSIGVKELWRVDETRVAGISASMARTGDYWMPRLNGEPFLEYPPMYYWATAGFYQVLGRNPFASRLASALCALGSVFLVFLLAREMGFGPPHSFLAGAILATCGEFWAVANRCLVDMMLCFFIVSAMVCFFKVYRILHEGETSGGWVLYGFLFSLSLGFAILTKSLVGLAVPSVALFFWLVLECLWNRKPYFKSWLALGFGCLLSAVPALFWLVEIYGNYGMEAVRTVAEVNAFGRFTGSQGDHLAPFFYYFGKVPEQFLPWTVFLAAVPALMLVYRKKPVLDRNARFLVCWILFPFLLLVLSASKRPVYLLPLYPAFALLLSLLLRKATAEIPILARFPWDRIWLSFSALVSLVLVIAGFVLAALYNDKFTFRPLFAYYGKSPCAERPLYLYTPTEAVRGAVNYYLDRDVPVIQDETELEKVLDSRSQPACVIAPHFPGIESRGSVKTFVSKGDPWCVMEGR
ncbi:MAG TPA: glycosyltransferase family 39 protein [Syntrophobacteraceae bacterium]|nr:glycosyltransferase family 39 protein [Syntrophobacteraceae bacterium]